MAEPFVGQINMFGFNFAPVKWSTCEGQILPIAQFQALYSLLGTSFGGDGRSSVGLPDLRGRLPMGMGAGPGLTDRRIGEKQGLEATGDVPMHSHSLSASTETTGLTQVPSDGWTLAAGGANTGARDLAPVSMYTTAAGTVKTSTSTEGVPGVSLINPMQVINFCIALDGIYPQRP